MPYYGDGVPYYYGGPFANHSSLMTGISRYHNPIAARYSPHLSTITESPLITLRRFSPAATTASTSVSIARSRRIIDTADIDVTKKPRSLTQDNRQSRHRLRRDRPTIKIRSQALKDNPALREYNEKHEKSVGELLVEKFLIKDKQYEEDRPKIKLYHQASLMSSDNNNEDTFDERENELLAAIRRRVTRRMTRRRSSVDIIPLDPEQIQREAAYHAAQAEALDNLVAEEQAEIEVEMRRGTFAKRQAMKLPLEISEISETEDDDELDIEERINSASKKHVTTKKKKKRKIIDKPKSEEENDRKDSIIVDSIIEEEEFEWDDREKCNDVAKIVPKLEKMNKQKDITIENNQIKENVKQNDILKRREKGVIGFNKHITTDHTSKEEINQTSELKSKNRKIQDKERLDKVKPKEKEKEEKLSVEKKLENVSKNCTHIIAEQKEVDTKDSATHFKIEACNSVGDFSTLYINAANTPTSEKPVRTIEQFRESIRLPAPRRPGSNNIETEVVLPVHKPYIHDTSRNSVYLALKPSQTARPNKMQDIDDQQIEQIINDEIRKESLIDSSRSAKWGEVGGDRSAQESNSIDERKNNASKIINATVLQSQQTEKNLKSESDQTLNKFEKLVNKSSKPSLLGVKEEFIENFKKEKNNIVENKIDNKLNLTNNIEPEEIIKNETQNLTKAKCNLNNKPETGLEFEKKIKESLDEVKKKINTVKVESKKLTNKIDNFKLESKSLIEPEFKIEDNIKNKVEITSKNKVGDLSEKTKSQVKVIKDTVKDVISESKLKNTNQITDAKKIVNKSAFSEEIPSVEGSNQLKTTEKFQCPLKVLHENSPQTKPDQLSISTTEQNVFNTDLTTPKRDLPRKNDRHLPKILEEPKSPPTTVTQQIKLPQLKKNDTKANKSSLIKESDNKVNKLVTEPNLTIVPKNDKKKKIDTEGTMKIEKKILEDEESPHKISTTVLPETACITETSTALLKNDEKQKEPLMSSAKVGLQSKTKKKSSELPVAVEATEATAAVTEIDFWSEIGAQEGGAKVSGMPKKVQSAVDLTRINEQKQQAIKSSEPLTLDLSNVKAWTEDQDKLKTPLILDQEELKTPLILEPKSPLVENLKQVPLINLQLTDDNRATIIYNDTYELDNKNKISKEKEKNKESVEETQAELSGTVKKISKWTNRDNLSNLNETDEQVTSVAYKEAAPQVSTPPSTSTKKKIVKKKKSTPSGTKKKSDKVESAKSKTNNKSKVATKKPAASPQTSQLKTAMSASGSPRNTPNQRPPDLMKLFYTTPAILLTATPRDLRKVRRAKVKRKKPQTRTPSLSSDSTGSTRSTATTSTEEGSNCEEDNEQKRQTSTRSNDSGFDGSPRLSTPSQSSENQRNAEGDHFHHSGRITPPATNLPRFKKYEVTDFNFLKVLGKGSFGKVLLAELRGTECVYAVKCLKKDVVLEDDDVECTLIERKVLTLATRHPYLCHLFCTFQTESHLFFVMEYLNGGDLMFHIQKSGRFAEQRAKFYAAEIWSGLIFLHKKGIVYRDLKLDNVLLDFEGHIRIADFGMCKLQIFLDRTADTFCGTPDYMAPEIIKGLKYNQAVDWWSFGVLLYEMLTGQSPFSGCDEDELFWSICNERPFIPRYLGQSATDLLVSLLEKDSGKRIPGHEIACHPFFCTVAWDKLERRSLEPPFKPAVEHTLDTRYFDTAFTAERPRLTAVPEQILTSMDQGVFRGFSYTNPNATD